MKNNCQFEAIEKRARKARLRRLNAWRTARGKGQWTNQRFWTHETTSDSAW